jgi:hypothetical protein
MSAEKRSSWSRRDLAVACGITALVVLALITGGSERLAAEEAGAAAKRSDTPDARAARLAPAMVARASWQANAALPGMKAQAISGIILHHTGVRKNPKISVESKMRGLQSFSQRPGQVSSTHAKPAWPDVPYHYYVDVGGRTAEGRDVHFAGDTNTNYDTLGYIQVVVEGDFEKEAPEPAQLAALRDLLVWLTVAWSIPMQRISVHMDHASTDCPGRNFMTALPSLLSQVAEQRAKAIN